MKLEDLIGQRVMRKSFRRKQDGSVDTQFTNTNYLKLLSVDEETMVLKHDTRGVFTLYREVWDDGLWCKYSTKRQRPCKKTN